LISGYISQGVGAGLQLSTLGGGGTQVDNMTLTTGGRVGIGTASPVGKLTVAVSGDAENTTVAAWSDKYFCVGQSVTTTSSAVAIGFNNSTNSGWIYSLAPSTAWRALNYGAQSHSFYCQNATASMVINSSGRVGIGTTSPGWTLQTSGTACLGYGIYANANNDGDARHYITYATTTTAGSVGTNADARLNIQDRSSNYIRFFNGFPNTTVSLQGLIYQSGGSTLYAASSDYRLKSNIAPLSNALGVISSLKPITFTFNSHPDIKECGFIAHEVQEIIPNCVNGTKDGVSEDGSIHPQALDKAYIVSYLVGAVQELSTENAQLKARLESLETRFTAAGF
jgi:hypothetical protein